MDNQPENKEQEKEEPKNIVLQVQDLKIGFDSRLK